MCMPLSTAAASLNKLLIAGVCPELSTFIAQVSGYAAEAMHMHSRVHRVLHWLMTSWLHLLAAAVQVHV